jgi:D-lactate dehydrogenase
LSLLEPTAFTTDPVQAAQFWKVRSGLLASVGGARPSGSSFILEDICFPPERLADGALDVQALFAKHGYNGVIFGHASAGNLHFLITPSLNDAREIARYTAFMDDVVRTVVERYDGSLKAEHGTGRNIAPFVEKEWGSKLTALMWHLKRLADPDGILSPGVLLTTDPLAHTKHLHTSPPIEAVADRCIECGFCEHVCPSRLLTTTPRQRILLRREMLRQPTGSPVLEALLREYEYDAIETCAGDGMCAVACPVDINTGAMMKQYRQLEHGPMAERVAERVAQHWDMAEVLARATVGLGNTTTRAFGDAAMRVLTSTVRAVVSTDLAPAWIPAMPRAANASLPTTKRTNAAAVYFSACINRIFGPALQSPAQPTLQQAFVAVSERAGFPLWIPNDIAGTCCATVWNSKGYRDGNTTMANNLVEKLWRWSDGGHLPIVIDASSCTYGALHEVVPYLTEANAERHARITIHDSVAWVHDFLLPRLTITHKVAAAVIHPTCATDHLGVSTKLQAIAAVLAESAAKPVYATCCGFAGDRGFLHPELAKAATTEEAQEVQSHTYDAYLCSNRTCEVGMSAATGQPYQSFVFLLEEVTRES